MTSVSHILRQTREAKGISLEDVAQRTYIKLPYLVALEEGRIDELLAPVFVHGYIRQYARLLGLNAAELVGQYQQDFRREIPSLALTPAFIGGEGDDTGSGIAGNGHAPSRQYSPDEEADLSPESKEGSPPKFLDRKVEIERSPTLGVSGSSVSGGQDAGPRGDRRDSPRAGSVKSESENVIVEAYREADRLRKDAEKYAFQLLSQLEAELGRTLAVIKNGRQYLQQKRRHSGQNEKT